MREFLASLGCKREELATAGVTVMEKEYECTILRGIPNELATFASHLMSSALIVHGAKSINLDALTNQICEEADRLKSRHSKGQREKKDSTDKALSATASNDGKQQRCKGKCNACGKFGHQAKECRSSKKDKKESAGTQTAQASSTSISTSNTSKPENKPVGSANIIYDIEGNGFWMATDEAIDQTHLMCHEPDLMLGVPDDTAAAPHHEGEEFDGPVEEELAGAVITQANEDHRMCIELYDSGATRHISPYKSDFISYSPLAPPIFLNTANQQRFLAIGHGTLVINVPNGSTESELTLHGALHVPAVSYTLVLLTALDEEGYHAYISAGHMKLTSPQGECVGRIPQMPRHLYKVMHTLDSANTVEPISAIELHRCLSHIAVSSAHKLVTSNTITRVKLDPDIPDADCEACIFACAAALPVPKVRIGPPTQNFGDEVHTDVWGPAQVTMCQGRRYFITFTDNATRYTVTYLMRTKDKALEA